MSVKLKLPGAMKVLSSNELEQLESLTAKKILALKEPHLLYENFRKLEDTRPRENFLDLMKWVEKNFWYENMSDNIPTPEKFIHNRVLIDGQFLDFCQERKITITPLYRDSFVSWRTEHDFERFFAQGVFKIQGNGFEFLHAALFHKGNQNEDEIALFILVSKDNYDAYIKVRNEFDDWVIERDRGNLHIKVIDGVDMPYTRDHDWKSLFLPDSIKDELQLLVESFLSSKDFYLSNKIPWKRGVLLYGEPGNGKTSIIRTIISTYNFKPVTIDPGTNDAGVREAFSYAEEQSPSLLYFEDLDSLLEKVDISSFLNLMDGISAKNGLLVVATANDVSKLKSNITDRPSRFDRKFEIPLPDEKMCAAYLKKWFANLIAPKKCEELAKHAVKYEFSYAYLKELYISSMFEALSNNRKVPSAKDISKALDRLMKDKNILKSGKTINTDKYFK